MNQITIELTSQQAQWLLEFIDCGLRANGVKALAAAHALQQTLEAAVKTAQQQLPANNDPLRAI